MVLLPSLETVVIICIILGLLWVFVDRKRTPWWAITLTTIGWYFGFSIICFIPLDIYTSLRYQQSDFLVTWWSIFYWGSFALNYVILPYVVGFLEAGEFTTKGKVWASIKSQLPWYALYFVLLAGICIFLYLTDPGKVTLDRSRGLEGVIIGLSIAAGLVQLSFLLGFGLVKIPWNQFRTVTLDMRFKYQCYKVAYYWNLKREHLFETKYNLNVLLYCAEWCRVPQDC